MTVTVWVVGNNDPGYLPDSEPSVYANPADAKQAAIDDLLWFADSVGSEDAAEDLTHAAEDLNLSDVTGGWGDIIAGRSYWIEVRAREVGDPDAGLSEGDDLTAFSGYDPHDLPARSDVEDPPPTCVYCGCDLPDPRYDIINHADYPDAAEHDLGCPAVEDPDDPGDDVYVDYGGEG